MKFLHLGDLHIGKSVNEVDLLEDQRYMLKNILKAVEEEEIDALLIAGDIYDRSIPSEAAVRLLDEFLTGLADRNIPVLLISGNHDSDERLDFLNGPLKARGIYIRGCYHGEIPRITLKDDYGPIHIYLLPYVKASTVRHYFPEEKIESYEDAIRTAIAHTKINTAERNLILSHQFVTCGEKGPELGGSELSAHTLGTIDNISASVYDAFDYAALGHIHKSQAMGRSTVRYSGSLLKYSLREIGQKREFPVIDMREKGTIDISTIAPAPLHEMRHLKGTYEEIKKLRTEGSTEDYLYVTLTDEEYKSDAIRLLRDIYPNIMKLDYDNAHTRGISAGPSPVADCRSYEDILREFFESTIGGAPDEAQWAILKDAAGKAGLSE